MSTGSLGTFNSSSLCPWRLCINISKFDKLSCPGLVVHPWVCYVSSSTFFVDMSGIAWSICTPVGCPLRFPLPELNFILFNDTWGVFLVLLSLHLLIFILFLLEARGWVLLRACCLFCDLVICSQVALGHPNRSSVKSNLEFASLVSSFSSESSPAVCTVISDSRGFAVLWDTSSFCVCCSSALCSFLLQCLCFAEVKVSGCSLFNMGGAKWRKTLIMYVYFKQHKFLSSYF